MSWIERWNKRRLGMKKKVVGENGTDVQKVVGENGTDVQKVVGENGTDVQKVFGEIVLGDNWVNSDEGEEMDGD